MKNKDFNVYEKLCYLETSDISHVRNQATKILKDRGVDLDTSIPRKIPKCEIKNIEGRFGLFNEIFNEDWDYLFKGKYSEKKNFYVYYHCNPFISPTRFGNDKNDSLNFKGYPFYIGKGCNDRHLETKRSPNHSIYLNKILKMGSTINDVSHLLFNNLTEKEAFIIESKLIMFLGTKSFVFHNEKWIHGRYGGFLINTVIPKHPTKYDKLFGI